MSAAVQPPLLDAYRLVKTFPGTSRIFRGPTAVHAVSDVSFSIAAGEILGIVGESGSGKSTIARLALRMLNATSGTIRFDGTDVGQLSTMEFRQFQRSAQMVFQDPYGSLDPRWTVGQTLSEGIRLHRIASGSQARERVAQALVRVGLGTELLKRKPRALSGGQRQRVAIARALTLEPRLVVADEAVSALDVSVQAEVLDLLRSLRLKLNLAMMFISHDLRVVEELADRVMVLYLGKVMEIGPTARVYAAPSHPYTRALLEAAPALPGEQRRDRMSLRGDSADPLNPPKGCVFSTRCPHAVPICSMDSPPLREVVRLHHVACWRDDLPGVSSQDDPGAGVPSASTSQSN